MHESEDVMLAHPFHTQMAGMKIPTERQECAKRNKAAAKSAM